MPVRQIQFPSLPQQSRLIGLQPMSSVHAAKVPCRSTHTRTSNTQQHHNQASTHQSWLGQRSNAVPVVQGAAAATGGDSSRPLAVPNAEVQSTHRLDHPQAVTESETAMPSTASDHRPLAAADAVGLTAAALHPPQLPQQLPQQLVQQLPQQLPYPHITWPQPVVSWPRQVAEIAQNQAANWHGEGIHQAWVFSPSHLATGHSAGSATLQGGTVDSIREHAPPLLPAGPAHMQGVALIHARPLQPSLAPAGPAARQGVAFGPSRHQVGPLPPAESAPGGTHAHTHPLPVPLPLAGSAPVQGPMLSPNRPSSTPPLPASAAPFQQGTLAPLESSLPLAGSVPPCRGTLAGLERSAPLGAAAQSLGQSWDGDHSDPGASMHGSVMPPNKR